MAVSDYLLVFKGPDVKGESQDDKYPESVEVDSFSISAHNDSTHRHGAGGGHGKVFIGDLQINKRLDKASATLFDKLCCGDHIKEITLYCRKKTGDEGNALEHLKIKMGKGTISSLTIGGHGQGTGVSESLTLAFEAIVFEYTEQKADGNKGAVCQAGWNHAKNKRVIDVAA